MTPEKVNINSVTSPVHRPYIFPQPSKKCSLWLYLVLFLYSCCLFLSLFILPHQVSYIHIISHQSLLIKQQSPSVASFLLSLNYWKSPGQWSCRISCSLDTSDCLLMSKLKADVSGKSTNGDVACLSQHDITCTRCTAIWLRWRPLGVSIAKVVFHFVELKLILCSPAIFQPVV